MREKKTRKADDAEFSALVGTYHQQSSFFTLKRQNSSPDLSGAALTKQRFEDMSGSIWKCVGYMPTKEGKVFQFQLYDRFQYSIKKKVFRPMAALAITHHQSYPATELLPHELKRELAPTFTAEMQLDYRIHESLFVMMSGILDIVRYDVPILEMNGIQNSASIRDYVEKQCEKQISKIIDSPLSDFLHISDALRIHRIAIRKINYKEPKEDLEGFLTELLNLVAPKVIEKMKDYSNVKTILDKKAEFIKILGIRYQTTNSNDLGKLQIPELSIILKRWHEMSNENKWPVLTACRTDGIADNNEFTLINLLFDLIVSNNKQFVHDILIHVIPTLRYLMGDGKDNPNKCKLQLLQNYMHTQQTCLHESSTKPETIVTVMIVKLTMAYSVDIFTSTSRTRSDKLNPLSRSYDLWKSHINLHLLKREIKKQEEAFIRLFNAELQRFKIEIESKNGYPPVDSDLLLLFTQHCLNKFINELSNNATEPPLKSLLR